MNQITPKQVKKLRLYLGITQEQFAKKLGVCRDTVIQWESQNKNRSRGMSDILFEVACMKFKVKKEEFLT